MAEYTENLHHVETVKRIEIHQTEYEEEVEERDSKMHRIQNYTHSSVRASFAGWDEDGTHEMTEMVAINKRLAAIDNKLQVLGSATTFIDIITDTKRFVSEFDNLKKADRTEIKRLRKEVASLEAERNTLSKDLAVEKSGSAVTIRELTEAKEKTQKDISELRAENRNLQIEITKLTERLNAEIRKTKRLEEDIEYSIKTMDEDNIIREFMGGDSVVLRMDSLERKLNDAITNIIKQNEEKVREAKSVYEYTMTRELTRLKTSVKEGLDEKWKQHETEIDIYKEEINNLKEQLELKGQQIIAMKNSHDKYKKMSEEKLRVLEYERSIVDLRISEKLQKEMSVKTEIGLCGSYTTQIEKRISSVRVFPATVLIWTDNRRNLTERTDDILQQIPLHQIDGPLPKPSDSTGRQPTDGDNPTMMEVVRKWLPTIADLT